MSQVQFNEIPFFLKIVDYFLPKIGNVYDSLKAMGVQYFTDIEKINEEDFLAIHGMSPAKWEKVLRLKEIINTRKTDIVDYFTYCIQRCEFPILNNEGKDLSIDEMAAICISQLTNHLKIASKFEKPYAKLYKYIDCLLINDFDKEQIKAVLGVSSNERVRQLKVGMKKQLSVGKFDGINNIFINDDFLLKIRTVMSELPIFNSITVLNETFGCSDYGLSSIRHFIDIKCIYSDGNEYKRFDQPYYIPTELPYTEICKYINAITGLMAFDSEADIRPLPFGYIMESLIENYPDTDFDPEIVENILQQHTWIRKEKLENGIIGYMLDFEYLKDYQKIARIIYERKHVTLEEISQVLAEYGVTNLNGINPAKRKYKWITLAGRNGVYSYNPSGIDKKSLAETISEYAEKEKKFYFEDMLQHLNQVGFSNLNEGTIRTYIMKSCQCSIDDPNLFCHSDHLDEYKEIRWRARIQNGLFNWLLSRIIEFLKIQPNHKANKKDIVAALYQDNPENYQLKNDLFSYLYKYIGPDELFIVDKDILCLTENSIGLTEDELKKIGLKQRTPEYYKDAISFILSLLKKSDNGEVLMATIKNECIEAIPDMPWPAFYKIVDHHLPDQISKHEINGKTYLRINEEKVEYLPSYVIDMNALADMAQEEPTLMASEVGRITPTLGERICFSWTEIKEAMLKEFSFYRRWWDLQTSMEEGIDKFIEFMISKASNNRLQKFIPQSIYEFWNFKNDEMDYYRYLIDITACYEKLLVDINTANGQSEVSSIGLMSIVNEIPEITRWVNYSECKGFVKTFSSLKHIRNKSAHGQDIDTGLLSMIQNTTAFIALYVYTVARFWNQQ